MTGGRTIAGQYGTPTWQQHFGRPDPFCLFAVLPMVIIAGLAIWGGIAILGVALVFLTVLIVVIDSWANRPTGKPAPAPPRYRQDY